MARESEDLTERPPLATSTRDLAELASQLAGWWLARTPGAGDVAVTGVATPGGTGVANETILFDLAWTLDGVRQERACVARIEAAQQLFLGSDLREHARVIRALGPSAVPVPELLALEEDASYVGAPFYVMSRVAGDIPSDEPCYNDSGWLAEASEDQQRQVWRSAVETLATLHRTDVDALSFLRPSLSDDLAHWRSAALWAADGASLPVLEQAGAWLSANLPAGHEPGFSWGDARYANLVFSGFSCAAVLDWDMASLAGAEADLGWWLLFEHTASTARGLSPLPGLGTSAETIALWESLMGRSARDLEWFVVYAAYRMCVAVTRAASMLTHGGILPPGSEMLTNNVGTQYLVSMLALEPAGAQLVSWPGLPAREPSAARP